MLENTDYMVAGVKVTRLPVHTPTPPAHSEFDIAMTDSDETISKVRTIGRAEPLVIRAGDRRTGTMKVITVAATEIRRDDAIVTITPASQRGMAFEGNTSRPAESTPAPQSDASSRTKGPNWIFGHE